MSVKELFKTASEDPIIVNSINIDNAFINLKTNKDGQVNWDIAKANTNNTPSNASNNNSFVFDIENYSINNSAFNYVDESANTLIKVTNINYQN